jgi:hypothetical protein
MASLLDRCDAIAVSAKAAAVQNSAWFGPDVFAALIAGLFGLGVALLPFFLKYRKTLESEFDKDLRKLRIDAYMDLWKRLEPLAFYAPPGPVTYQTLTDLAASLRQWYYEVGGLFLSSHAPGGDGLLQRSRTAEGGSRAPYFVLQETLRDVLARAGSGDLVPSTILPANELELVKEKASALRTSLAADVGTRRESDLRRG